MPPRKNSANIGSYKHISPTIKVKNHSSDSMIQCHCPSFHSCSSMIFYASGPPSHVINTAAFACSGCNAGAVFTKRPSWKVCSCSGSRSFLTKCCQEVQNQSPNLQTRFAALYKDTASKLCHLDGMLVQFVQVRSFRS